MLFDGVSNVFLKSGQLVSTSLLKQGCWAMSAELSKAKVKDDIDAVPDYSDFAKPHPLNDAYTTKDGFMVKQKLKVSAFTLPSQDSIGWSCLARKREQHV